MIWNLMLSAVHLVALLAFIYLYKSAPCWIQRLVVSGFILGMFFISAGYLIDFVSTALPVHGWWGGLYFRDFGYATEHIAVLLYVFRLVYQQHEPKSQGDAQLWLKSSAHSPA